ncbi:IS3 family transposase [Rahnella aceris]|uniref:IS3 family transposase n=1 Tax=Rahnella sp. (strain Y9602) TaxID=2703885 RepID=UPI0036662967
MRLLICKVIETLIYCRYRRIHVMLRHEGWRDNHKRIYRLNCQQGLLQRLKRPRRSEFPNGNSNQGLNQNHL